MSRDTIDTPIKIDRESGILTRSWSIASCYFAPDCPMIAFPKTTNYADSGKGYDRDQIPVEIV
jgi:hypothetical protein